MARRRVIKAISRTRKQRAAYHKKKAGADAPEHFSAETETATYSGDVAPDFDAATSVSSAPSRQPTGFPDELPAIAEGCENYGEIYSTQCVLVGGPDISPLQIATWSPTAAKRRKSGLTETTTPSPSKEKNSEESANVQASSGKRRRRRTFLDAYYKRMNTQEKMKRAAAARAKYAALTPVRMAKREASFKNYRSMDFEGKNILKCKVMNARRCLLEDSERSEAVRKARRMQDSKRRRAMTPDTRGKTLEKKRLGAKHHYDEMTPDTRGKTLEKKRLGAKRHYDEMTPKTKERFIESRQTRYKEVTPGTKDEYRRRESDRQKEFYADLTPGSKELYLRRKSEGAKERYADLTPSSKDDYLRRKSEGGKERYAELTPSSKDDYRTRESERMKQRYASFSPGTKSRYVGMQAHRVLREMPYRKMTDEQRKRCKERAGRRVMAKYRMEPEYRLKVKEAVCRRRAALRRMRIGQFKTTTTALLKRSQQKWLYSVLHRLANSERLSAGSLAMRKTPTRRYRDVKLTLAKVLVLRARTVKRLLQKISALETYLIEQCASAELTTNTVEAEAIIQNKLARKKYHIRSWDNKEDQQNCQYFDLDKDISFPNEMDAVVASDAIPLPRKSTETEENPLCGIMEAEASDEEFEGFTVADVEITEALKKFYAVRQGEGETARSTVEEVTEADGEGAVDTQEGQQQKKPGVVAARPCNEDCRLPTWWATRIYRRLRQLKSHQNLPQILETLFDIETCSDCLRYGPVLLGACSGSKMDTCMDVLHLLRSVSPHNAGMRTIQSRYYSIRQDAEWILDCDRMVNSGDYWAFRAFIRHRCPKLIEREETDAEKRMQKTGAMRGRGIEEEVEEKYGHLREVFLAKLNDFPKQGCSLCDRLTEESKMKVVERKPRMGDKGKAMWERVARELERRYPEENVAWPKKICNNCMEQIKSGKVPRYSFLNGMDYVEPPDYIKNLNDVERMLTQRAKYMVTVIKLMPYSKRVAMNAATRGMRGFGFYMPLPDDEIKKSLKETMLPSVSNYEILVDCHPTKKSIIWQYPVRSAEVLKALTYLKNNNELYNDITIDEHFEERLGQHLNVITSEQTSTELQVEAEVMAPEKDTEATSESRTSEPQTEHVDIVSLEAEEETTVPSGRNVMQMFDLLSYVPGGQSLPGFSVKRIQADYPNKADTDLFRMGHLAAPPAYDDKLIEEKCFPELYVTGKYGFTQPREAALRRGDYIKARILHKSGAWRRKTNYLFHARQWKDINNLRSGVYAMVNISKTGHLTAGSFLKQVEEGNRQLDAGLNMMMSKLPNSAAFLNQKRTDLIAMDEVLGPATLFITLSCAEYYWSDMDKFLRGINQDLKGIATMPIGQLAALDPAGVCMQFRQRFDAIEKVIMDPEGPLGQVTDYVWRVEYQARGAPHLHGKLWIKNAPVIFREDDDVVRSWIDEHITCELPERYPNPELYELVTKFQMHKCTPSCLRRKQSKTSFYYGCRFGYPQSAMPQTKINSMGAVAEAKGAGYRLPFVQLMRQKHERMINPYNPCILMLWQANMDIQFIGESSFVLNRYITGYMSKTEKNAAQEAFEGIDQSKSLYSRLLTYGVRAVRDRELGAYEAADNLLNNSIFFASRQVVFVGTAKKGERRRKLKSKTDIEGLCDESTEIFCNNMVDTYYPNRPDTLEDMSLHKFAAKYERLGQMTGKTDQALSRQQELKNDKGVIRERTKEVIVKSTYFQAGTEEYYRSMLLLHKPWREEETLIGECETYQEAFKQEVQNLKALAEADYIREKLDSALKELKNVEERAAQEAQRPISEEEEGQIWAEAARQDEGTETVTIGEYTEEEVCAHLASLNSKQAEIVKLVEDKVQKQEGHLDRPDDLDEDLHLAYPSGDMLHLGCRSRWFVHKKKCKCHDCESIKMFVSGLAGTGKSHVIKALQMSLDNLYPNEEKDPVVVVAAPTGLAALNVNGTTIHKLLKLPVQHGGDPEYWPLEQQDVKELRATFRNVRLIIIDEISMVSNVSLAFIDHRLREVYQNDKLFGGVNLVVFGDLLQLKPVRSQFCYVPITTSKMKAVFNTTYTYNIWSDFMYRELTENMRQRDDLEFAEMLARIRVGSPLQDDVEKLKQRVLCKTAEGETMLSGQLDSSRQGIQLGLEDAANFFVENMYQRDERSLCLLSKNIQVDQFNLIVMQKLKIDTVSVRAQDVAGAGRSEQAKRKKKGKKGADAEGELEKASETGGLATEVKIGQRCRVMLRRNVNLKRRLVNGSMGTVVDIRTGFHTDGRTPIVDGVFVLFDGMAQPELIERAKAKFVGRDGLPVQRSQIPLMPAYAVTVHKAQGLSLDNVMVTIDKDCFEDNMAYVALSRCRNINGLYFVRFEASFIHAFKDSWAQYNALRRQFTPDLGKLPDVNKNMYLTTSMRVQRVDVLQYLEAEPVLTTGVTNRGSQVRSVQPLGSSDYILKLRNEGGENACYVNAFVQALLRLRPIFDAIPLGYSQTGDELLRLHVQYERKCTEVESVSELRRCLDQGLVQARFSTRDQHDVTDIIYTLLSQLPVAGGRAHLPLQARARFNFNVIENNECTACGYKSTVNVDNVHILMLPCPQDRNTTFSQLLDMQQNGERLCECPGCEQDTRTEIKRKLVFGADQHYLLVLIPPIYVHPVTKERRRRTGKIKRFSANGQRIGGCKWITRAAVCYWSETGERGHYVCVFRTSCDGWATADDTSVVRPRRIFVTNLQDVMVLILERSE